MKLFAIGLVAAALAFAPPARAQQVASPTTCLILADGGVPGDGGTVACPAINTNFQPVIGTCDFVTPAHESNSGVIYLEGCVNATTCGPVGDAGALVIPFTQGGTSATSSAVSFATAVTNPWPYMQPVAVGTTGELSDGGANAAGYANCTFGVINAQTIHASRLVAPKKTEAKK